MTVKRNSRNVSTYCRVSCTFKGKNLRKHLFLRKKKKLKTADLYLFMEIMNHWCIIPFDRVREQHLETDFALPCG